MVIALNSKLETGWNPYFENESSKTFSLLTEVVEKHLNTLIKKVKDKTLRPDTLKSYKSNLY